VLARVQYGGPGRVGELDGSVVPGHRDHLVTAQRSGIQ
jgi:hypothetical protein